MEITVQENNNIEHILSRDLYNKERVLTDTEAIIYKILTYINTPKTLCEVLNIPPWNVLDKMILISSQSNIDNEVAQLKNNLIKMGIMVDEVNGSVNEDNQFVLEFVVDTTMISFNPQGIFE